MYSSEHSRQDLEYQQRVVNWARRVNGSHPGVHGSLDNLTHWTGQSSSPGAHHEARTGYTRQNYRAKYDDPYARPRDDYYNRKSRELSSHLNQPRDGRVRKFNKSKMNYSSDKDLGYSSDSSAQRRGGRGPHSAEGWGRKTGPYKYDRRAKSAGHTPNSTPDFSPPATPLPPPAESPRLDMIQENVETSPDVHANAGRRGRREKNSIATASDDLAKNKANVAASHRDSAKSDAESAANRAETSIANGSATPVANANGNIAGGMRRNISSTSVQSMTSERKVLTVTIDAERLSTKRRCQRACRKWPFFKYLCIVMFVLLLGFIMFSIIATVTGRWGFSTNNEDSHTANSNTTALAGS